MWKKISTSFNVIASDRDLFEKYFPHRKEEVLVETYICAKKRKASMSLTGNMFITTESLCFRGPALSGLKEEISFKDIVTIEKKYGGAGWLPDAIYVTAQPLSYPMQLFKYSKFMHRDQAYDTMMHVWRNPKGCADIASVKHSTKFNEMFEELSGCEEESLIQRVKCKCQIDNAYFAASVLAGTMYISRHFLCFATSPLLSRTMVKEVIPLKRITSLNKAKNTFLFDNAIAVTTMGGKDFLFTGFAKRGEIYDLLVNLWNQTPSRKRILSQSDSPPSEGDFTSSKGSSSSGIKSKGVIGRMGAFTHLLKQKGLTAVTEEQRMLFGCSFSTVPKEEKVSAAFSATLYLSSNKIRGTMFVTPNFLAFCANEEAYELVIPIRSIITLERQAKMKLFPGHGIRITTVKGHFVFGHMGESCDLIYELFMAVRHFKSYTGNVFGVSLKELVGSEGNDPNTFCVPVIHASCVKFLRLHDAASVEGIFRVNGPVDMIEKLKERFEEATDEGQVVMSDCNCLAVGDAYKMWLRELPDALVPHKFYDKFIAAFEPREDDSTERVIARLVQVSEYMPTVHQAVLASLLGYLHEVAEMEDVNKMSSSNLAIIFGPTVFRKETGFDMADHSSVTAIMKHMIQHPSAFDVFT